MQELTYVKRVTMSSCSPRCSSRFGTLEATVVLLEHHPKTGLSPSPLMQIRHDPPDIKEAGFGARLGSGAIDKMV